MIEFFADGEELAEGGVQSLLAEISPALERNGLCLDVQTISDLYQVGEGDYILSINGTRCTIWTEEEVLDTGLWLKATARPLTLVNTLLSDAGTGVRVHLLREGGNDGLLLLLDSAVPTAMRASGLFRESDIPALPTRLN